MSKRVLNKSTNDDFEINKRIGKEIEKNLNGIEKHPKVQIREILGGSLNKLKFKNRKQKDYSDSIINPENSIIIAKGSAGTGKSYISVYTALKLLLDESNDYTKIWLSTSVTPIPGEGIGFLPAGVNEKMWGVTLSTMCIIESIIGRPALNALIEKEFVSIMPLAFIRGFNIPSNAIFILEEAQNCVKNTLKAVLTRGCEGSKMILSGDEKQTDKNKSGLNFIYDKLQNIEGVALIEFDENDIVRHPLIVKILKIFEESE